MNPKDDSSPSAHRVHYKFLGIAFAAITITFWLLMSLYWGSYYRQDENAYRLTVRIIDLDSQAYTTADGAVLGPAVVQAAQMNELAMPDYHLGWQFEQDLERFSLAAPGTYGNLSDRGIDVDTYARDLVLDQTVFGVIIIHSNATSAATMAYQGTLTGYEPQGAAAFYYEEARNFYSEDQHVSFLSTQMLSSALNTAATTFASRQLLAASTATGGYNLTGLCPTGATLPAQGAMSSVSTIPITQPFYYSTFNLRPFDAFAATASTTAGAIYLIIFTFYIGLFFKQSFEGLAKDLTVFSEIFTRLLVPGLGYFWISLMYTLVSLAFEVPFTRYFGHIGFFLSWMLNFVTQLALGYTMELVLLTAGPLVFPFFLLFWVILNVSVAFLDIADMDPWYSYGFLMPVWNNVDGTKCIVFATKNHLGQNFGVCLGWMVFSASGIAIATWWKKSKLMKQREAEREEKIREYERHHGGSHKPIA